MLSSAPRCTVSAMRCPRSCAPAPAADIVTTGNRLTLDRAAAAAALGTISGQRLGPTLNFPAAAPGVDASVVAGLLGAALATVGLALALLVVARWRRRRRGAADRDRRAHALDAEANRLLIEADNALREAGQDLGFAEAQFDDADVAPLRTAIAMAQSELGTAFSARHGLDTATGDPTEPEALDEVVGRCKRVLAALGAERTRIEGLRERDRHAPEVLAGLPDRVGELERRMPGVETAMERLQAYAPACWTGVVGNVDEARERLGDARAEAERGNAALETTPADLNSAARAARRALGLADDAGVLLDAVERRLATLQDARRRVDVEVGEAARAVQAAKDSIAVGRPLDPGLAAAVSEAEVLLAQARSAVTGDHPDPEAGISAARRARAGADAVLASAQEAAVREARRAAVLATAMHSAEMSIGRATDYVAAQEGAVRSEARTRLLEARQHYDQAASLATADAERATREARTADRLGDEAYGLARSDAEGWDRRTDGLLDPGAMILASLLGGRPGHGDHSHRSGRGRAGGAHHGGGCGQSGHDRGGGC